MVILELGTFVVRAVVLTSIVGTGVLVSVVLGVIVIEVSFFETVVGTVVFVAVLALVELVDALLGRVAMAVGSNVEVWVTFSVAIVDGVTAKVVGALVTVPVWLTWELIDTNDEFKPVAIVPSVLILFWAEVDVSLAIETVVELVLDNKAPVVVAPEIKVVLTFTELELGNMVVLTVAILAPVTMLVLTFAILELENMVVLTVAIPEPGTMPVVIFAGLEPGNMVVLPVAILELRNMVVLPVAGAWVVLPFAEAPGTAVVLALPLAVLVLEGKGALTAAVLELTTKVVLPMAELEALVCSVAMEVGATGEVEFDDDQVVPAVDNVLEEVSVNVPVGSVVVLLPGVEAAT